MFTLRRETERHHDRGPGHEVWRTFDPENRRAPLVGCFGVLEILDEYRLEPAAACPRLERHDAEILTYVRQGVLSTEDSMGRSGVIYGGELQRMTATRGLRHRETNASHTDPAQVFRIGLRVVAAELESTHEERRFSAAERRGELCIVASPDRRKGSLRLHQDTLVYLATLDRGQHVVHELRPGRSAWLHVVEGEVALGDIVLTTGDSVAMTSERAVSLTARDATEILLLDLGDPAPKT